MTDFLVFILLAVTLAVVLYDTPTRRLKLGDLVTNYFSLKKLFILQPESFSFADACMDEVK